MTRALQFVVRIKSLRTESVETRAIVPKGGASLAFSLGSSQDQDLILDGIAAKHAVVSRRGHHTIVRPEPGASVFFFGGAVSGERRIDDAPFLVGDYELSVDIEEL